MLRRKLSVPPIPETIRGFREIIEGKHDDIPQIAFSMVGGIDDVLENVRKGKV